MDSATDTLDAEVLDAEVAEKKDLVLKRLSERSEARKLELLTKKDESNKTAAETETLEYFTNTFEAKVDYIRQQLLDASSQPKVELGDYFDSLVLKHAELQKFVSDSAFFLTSHELSAKQQILGSLLNEIGNEREKFFPKKKFAFKNKKKQTSSTLPSQQQPKQDTISSGDGSQTCGSTAAPDYNLSTNEHRVSDKSGQVIVLSAQDINGKDVVVSQLTSCRLVIKGLPSAIHLNDLKECIVLSSPCSRSIFIERCCDSQLALACQQLRIHEASNCLFSIHVTSKAIIEDSAGLKFCPYGLDYPNKSADFAAAQLSMSVNNWADVDDFNWLVKNKQSPNWSALSSEEWRSFTLDA